MCPCGTDYPGNAPTTETEFKLFKRVGVFLKSTSTKTLNFVALDMSTVKQVFITDASFSNARGHKYQIGYVIAIMDSGRETFSTTARTGAGVLHEM